MTSMDFSIPSFPQLETARLLLRQETPEDAEAILAVFSDQLLLNSMTLIPSRHSRRQWESLSDERNDLQMGGESGGESPES